MNIVILFHKSLCRYLCRNGTEEASRNKVIPAAIKTRFQSSFKTLKRLFFICNEQRELHCNSYNCSGFVRCKNEFLKENT